MVRISGLVSGGRGAEEEGVRADHVDVILVLAPMFCCSGFFIIIIIIFVVYYSLFIIYHY